MVVSSKSDFCLILHNIRSALNVGSIFRTADASGVSKIYLSGYTPAPKDKFERINKQIAKSALGAENTITWEKVSRIKDLIKRLKKEGFSVVCVEQDKKSIDYRKFKPVNKTVFILGNEVSGITKDILSLADHIVEIPMKGEKESLNVSVATGIILFQTLN